MATSGGRDVEMRNLSSSPSALSSPPSISEPSSPTRYINKGRANIEMDEIVVDTASRSRFGLVQPPPADVPLTAAGLPRKKPGRKPGSVVKPKAAADGSSTNTEATKQRRPRKPRDPNAPPIQRRRKAAPAENQNGDSPEGASTGAGAGAGAAAATDVDVEARSFSGPSGRQSKITGLTSMRMAMDPPRPSSADQSKPFAQAVVKREVIPGSMQNLLNDDPPPQPQMQPQTAAPVSTARQIFDPVRSNYDPVRETMVTRDPYGTNASLGSPRAPTQVVNRASASPSIASLVDPPVASMISPGASQQSFHNTPAQPRFHESTSMPPSPSHQVPVRTAALQAPLKPTIVEVKRQAPPPPAPTTTKAAESVKPSFTVMSSSNTATAPPPPPIPVQSKKVAAVVQQEKQQKQSASTASSSPKVTSLKDALPAVPSGSERSILDFGKAGPGEEFLAPSIVLHIPLNGETNKYVNFMRMAEERYGWDALHPRQAAHRERKARIAAASAALEKNGSGRESGDEMSVDLQSDGEGSNVEMGGMGNGGGGGGGGTSGPDGATAKPIRKKRNFKEDEYDKDDDFVDDSELLWEEQAAASRDGFFVYSGPLVPEVEKPPAGSEGPPRRGRGGRGRGATTRGAREGSGRGRGGGPGSRGGLGTRKPRITKLEKQQLEREKAEREKMAQATSKPGSGYNLLQVTSAQPFATGMAMEH